MRAPVEIAQEKTMDTQQLKQLAGRIRARLEDASIELGHGQALDLIAALPGLRNWPEVQAFPNRVQACVIDVGAAGRLAFRLERKYGYSISASDLLDALLPPAERTLGAAPQIWPAGPAPGVYLTANPDAISALLARYEEATDGALLYAERAGTSHESAIDLGDNGLWSNGLTKAPSGTLIIVGPVELDQQSWEDASARIEMACLNVVNAEHRVAVLIETPTPEHLAADVALMVAERGDDDLDRAIIGWVTDDGELKEGGIRRTWPAPVEMLGIATTTAVSADVVQVLENAIGSRTTGILTFGSSSMSENPGHEIIEVGLALTDHLGPAARIMPRHRSTLAKFDDVPLAIRKLPFLPSIESAYAQGYRRFITDFNYTRSEVIERYIDNALFLTGTYAIDVDDLVMHTGRGYFPKNGWSFLNYLIAAAAITSISMPEGSWQLCDVYVKSGELAEAQAQGDRVYDFPGQNRIMRIEEQLADLINAGVVDQGNLAELGLGKRTVERLLAKLDD